MYRLYFKKEKMIFLNLNKCILRGNFIDGEIWIPEDKTKKVQECLQSLGNHSAINAFLSDSENSEAVPPTYFKTNDLTTPFQEIVDTYGIPRYREANPALFTIVTFPFLFGVMFGDIGHGFLLMLFGFFLVWKNDDLRKEDSPLKVLLRPRYLIFFMGIAAFYCGWMYNDFLSVPLGIFGTCYSTSKDGHTAQKLDRCVYPFGIDPKWYVASNELTFMNSLKMKLSVVLGVIHMSGGIIIKGMNAVYFKSSMDFFFEFIPQIIFMTLLFGYMIVMIFIKWATNWENTSDAPSIITHLMSIFLNFGSVGPDGVCYIYFLIILG
jgi:V-type H+-transporting ATPase subunit a